MSVTVLLAHQYIYVCVCVCVLVHVTLPCAQEQKCEYLINHKHLDYEVYTGLCVVACDLSHRSESVKIALKFDSQAFGTQLRYCVCVGAYNIVHCFKGEL